MKKIILLLALVSLCFAEIPRITNYQGKLTDLDGVAIHLQAFEALWEKATPLTIEELDKYCQNKQIED